MSVDIGIYCADFCCVILNFQIMQQERNLNYPSNGFGRLWMKVPLIIRSIFLGVGVSSIGVGIWVLSASVIPVPWSVLLMGTYKRDPIGETGMDNHFFIALSVVLFSMVMFLVAVQKIRNQRKDLTGLQ